MVGGRRGPAFHRHVRELLVHPGQPFRLQVPDDLPGAVLVYGNCAMGTVTGSSCAPVAKRATTSRLRARATWG
jgi:hypothetical protein